MSTEASKRFMETIDIRIDKKALKSLVDQWASEFGITVDAKESWLKAITNGATERSRKDDTRLFDVLSAATLSAQDHGAEEAEAMERMAGAMLMAEVRSSNEH